jgi:hypothetical protein
MDPSAAFSLMFIEVLEPEQIPIALNDDHTTRDARACPAHLACERGALPPDRDGRDKPGHDGK